MNQQQANILKKKEESFQKQMNYDYVFALL